MDTFSIRHYLRTLRKKKIQHCSEKVCEVSIKGQKNSEINFELLCHVTYCLRQSHTLAAKLSIFQLFQGNKIFSLLFTIKLIFL